MTTVKVHSPIGETTTERLAERLGRPVQVVPVEGEHSCPDCGEPAAVTVTELEDIRLYGGGIGTAADNQWHWCGVCAIG